MASIPEETTQLKQESWPSPQDYNEAVQHPQHNLDDAELRSGRVYCDQRGLPRPITGGFASVYRFKCTKRDLAMRCFLSNISNQEQRYALLSDFLQKHPLPYTITFDFMQKGIRVGGKWFPTLKMEWIDGDTLDQYVFDNLDHPEKLDRLARNFLSMATELKLAGIAHGDLQHGNILVSENGALRLVDYDGMFLPSLQHLKSSELGHCNFQHPGRKLDHFEAEIDNFSSWVIYASIIALQIDSSLWDRLDAGNDCLLFRQKDFMAPINSLAFSTLEHHTDYRLQKLSRFLRFQLTNAPDKVPGLLENVPEVGELEALPQRFAASNRGSSSAASPAALPANSASTESIRKTQPEQAAPIPHAVQSRRLPEWIKEAGENIAPDIDQLEIVALPVRTACPTRVQWIDPGTTELDPASVKLYSLQPELLQTTPRKVTPRISRPFNAQTLQLLMIFNPIFWFALLFLYQAYGPDNDLLREGKDYKGSVIEISWQKNGFFMQQATCMYRVNHNSYFTTLNNVQPGTFARGDSIYVHALPRDPKVAENIGSPPGTKKSHDEFRGLGCLLLCILFEIGIWLPDYYDRTLTRYGKAVLAIITEKVIEKLPNGQSNHRIGLRYDSRQCQICVHADQYEKLNIGDVVPILYDASGDPILELCAAGLSPASWSHDGLPPALMVYEFSRYECTSP